METSRRSPFRSIVELLLLGPCLVYRQPETRRILLYIYFQALFSRIFRIKPPVFDSCITTMTKILSALVYNILVNHYHVWTTFNPAIYGAQIALVYACICSRSLRNITQKEYKSFVNIIIICLKNKFLPNRIIHRKANSILVYTYTGKIEKNGLINVPPIS